MHILIRVEFEWDDVKRERNIRDHGVDFRTAREAFADGYALVQFDGRHSLTEERFFLLGKTAAGQLLMTIFTSRGTRIRIISSRRASRREVRGYEERIRLQ
jgi:uncharacterized DUF497 family protein